MIIRRLHSFIASSSIAAKNSYPLHLIAKMDETSLLFDMPPHRMINNTGGKTIKICTTGNEKNSVRVAWLWRWFES